MKILITGGLGFVGKHLTRELERAGHEIVKLDIRYDEDSYYCDLRDSESTRKLVHSVSPDACIHLGGIAFVPTGWTNPELVYSINLMGTLHLLEAFRHERPDARILVVSSSLIYQNAHTGNPLNETAYMYPPDIYAISKISSDLTALGYAKRYGMQIMTARPVNHIGPGQSSNFVITSFAEQLYKIKTGEVEPRMKVGNLKSQRDFLSVHDVTRAYRLLIEKGIPGEPYNIATGKLQTIQYALDMLCDISGIHPELEIDAGLFRPTDSSPVMNIEKIRKDVGWCPKIPLKQMLEDIYHSVEKTDNADTLRSVLSSCNV